MIIRSLFSRSNVNGSTTWKDDKKYHHEASTPATYLLYQGPCARMNPIDLHEELVEYLEEFALRSQLIANIIDNLDVDYETHTVQRRRLVPAAKSEFFLMKHARVYRTDKIQHQHDESTCCICYERLLDGISLTQMPCQHVYHSECLVKWLQTTNTCPECRFELKTDDPEFERERRNRMRVRQQQQQQQQKEEQNQYCNECSSSSSSFVQKQKKQPQNQGSLCLEKFA